jgi:hypothetical protein
MQAHAGITRTDLAAGSVVAVAIHALLGVALWLAPAGQTGAPRPDKAAATEGCASVVSPACVGAGQPPPFTPKRKDEEAQPADDRRCPEPLRRALRRELEPPPAVAVDLLQAELVAALGSETGTRVAPKPVVQRTEPRETLAQAIGTESKLKQILDTTQGDSEANKRKLGDIIGRVDGKAGGEGKVNMPGSAYVREVKIEVSRAFSLPATIPPWEAKELVAKVRITRMSASGGVLQWRLDKPSGNADFDAAVQALLRGYAGGVRSLPPPPDHLLQEINSRGFTIELRGGG